MTCSKVPVRYLMSQAMRGDGGVVSERAHKVQKSTDSIAPLHPLHCHIGIRNMICRNSATSIGFFGVTIRLLGDQDVQCYARRLNPNQVAHGVAS